MGPGHLSLFFLENLVAMSKELLPSSAPNADYDVFQGCAFVCEDFDEMFASLENPPIVINDESMRFSDDSARDELSQLIYEFHRGETLSPTMSCSCGKLSSKGDYKTICSHCGTVPEYTTEREIRSNIWMKVPSGIHGFISPVIWGMLSDQLTYKKFNILEYMTRRISYRPGVPEPAIMTKVNGLNLPGSLNEFIERYTEVIEILYKARIFRSKKQELEDLMTFLRSTAKAAFPKVLPFPNKLLMIQEQKAGRTSADPVMIGGSVDALLGLIGLNSPFRPPTPARKEARVVEACRMINNHMVDIQRERVYGKTGLIRKLVLGSQSHYSIRCVIVTDHGINHHRQLKLPWSASVLLFENHITSKCLHRGMTPVEISSLIHDNVNPSSNGKVHPLLKSILQEILDEAGPLGPSCSWVRWPTIYRASIMGMYIGGIKWDDPYDNTISFPVGAMKATNADVDGDQMAATIALDAKMVEAFERLRPSLSLPDCNEPFGISGAMALPVPTAATFAYYIHHGDHVCPVGGDQE